MPCFDLNDARTWVSELQQKPQPTIICCDNRDGLKLMGCEVVAPWNEEVDEI